MKTPKGNEPVIGILTQPAEDLEGKWPTNATMITATYIKFIESVGGKVVPIHYTHSFEHVKELMGKINGILFTGGDLDLVNPVTKEFHPYTKLAQFILNEAKEMNDRGDVFPIWGTCQGHQLLMMLVSEDKYIIEPSERWYKPDSLVLLKHNEAQLFKNIPEALLDAMEDEEICYNIHHLGITSDSFYKHEKLTDFFDLLAVNIDDNGVWYISITEGKKYPIYTVQFHPERNPFNFAMDNIPHSSNAIEFTLELADRFVEEARKSNHQFPTYEEFVASLIETNAIDAIEAKEHMEEYTFIHDFP